MKFTYAFLFMFTCVDGKEVFERPNPSSSSLNDEDSHVNLAMRYDAQKATAAQLAEHALIREFSSCLQLTFCTVGSHVDIEKHDSSFEGPPSEHSTATMAAGVKAAVQTFRQVLLVIKNRQPMIRMQQLVASYDVGAATRDPLICRSSFPCQTPGSNLHIYQLGKSAPREFGPLIDCSALADVCPGISIGCSLCAMFAPGTCSTTCTTGALFCGSTAIGCMEAKRQKKKDKMVAKQIIQGGI
ncbi:hypothetical protein TCAL_13495 [Tigriopus californicus]|uniref:Uncharacterized protein n=1 Tax=Tigriopus californicus TaxID=6832 RepID=A0A553PK16_TIGCA|nr:hypothetical protein TCAL_13495 [Tigriopus californicus]|eukprot:TCALIF_13495-PA protein Name:"Protein of unknown function" AED:0.00 eAED:0.00 QI:36/1/1/1/0/0/3/72/241